MAVRTPTRARMACTLAALTLLVSASPVLGQMQTGPVPASLAPATQTAAVAAPPAIPGPPAPPRNPAEPADLSIGGMIGHAGRVVQGVMAGLAVASVLCWTILLTKGFELVMLGRAVRRALALAEADEIGSRTPPRPLLLMYDAVRAEIAASAGASAGGTKERLASRLHRIELRLARQAQRGTGLLATIGSVSPFVGLFGTVWGIMNSFVGIARLHTTNLAVVAPGIAEALLATATGLVAAIPAVVIYNVFARWTAGYRHSLADLGEIVQRHAARRLDLPAASRVVRFSAAGE